MPFEKSHGKNPEEPAEPAVPDEPTEYRPLTGERARGLRHAVLMAITSAVPFAAQPDIAHAKAPSIDKEHVQTLTPKEMAEVIKTAKRIDKYLKGDKKALQKRRQYGLAMMLEEHMASKSDLDAQEKRDIERIAKGFADATDRLTEEERSLAQKYLGKDAIIERLAEIEETSEREPEERSLLEQEATQLFRSIHGMQEFIMKRSPKPEQLRKEMASDPECRSFIARLSGLAEDFLKLPEDVRERVFLLEAKQKLEEREGDAWYGGYDFPDWTDHLDRDAGRREII